MPNRMRSALAVWIGLLLLPALAHGQGAESGPVGKPSSSSSALDGGMGWGVLRLFIGLGIVIAIIAGIAWFVRRRQGIVPRSRGALPGLEALGSLPLAPNRAIHAVRLGDEIILVAMSEGAATVVARRSGEEASMVLGESPALRGDPLAAQIESSLRTSRARGGMIGRLRQLTVRS